ncbi:YitT family protein [Neobacillus drentensis]
MFRLIYQIILVGLCSMLFGFAYNTFLIPHKLASGGVTGIAFFIHHYLHINTGLIVLIINIPLLILGIKYLGKRFILYTIYSVVVLSYTVIAIYVAGRAVDMVYTNQNKLTLRIVTEKGDELIDALIHLHSRGITVHNAEGAYAHKPKKVLTTVITRFELNETKHTIKITDPHAFVNISQTLEVMGRFRKN